jgi:hypothetical protein
MYRLIFILLLILIIVKLKLKNYFNIVSSQQCNSSKLIYNSLNPKAIEIKSGEVINGKIECRTYQYYTIDGTILLLLRII